VAAGRPKALVRLRGSRRLKRGSVAVADANPRQRIAVVVHLKNPARKQPPDGSADDLAELLQTISRRALARRRSSEFAAAAEVVRAFAAAHGLRVRRVDLTRRLIILSGTVEQLTGCFGASFGIRRVGRDRFLSRAGFLSIPRELAPWTRAVLGLDQRPLVSGRLLGLAGNGDGTGLWPSEVAQRYGFPAGLSAVGQTVGIVALGGGFDAADLALACERMNCPLPAVVQKSVDGATNQPVTGDAADQELALDMQVVAGVAPGARIVVYFAPNSIEKIALAVQQAVFDTVNKPQVLSISWGSAERFWRPDVLDATRAALRDAVRVGVTVAASAGDGLATCSLFDHAAHVSFPASSPYVLCCGGTQPGQVGDPAGEEVWNQVSIGTGGGISDAFAEVPDYQTAAALPPSFNGGVGRGVPDVAGLAAGTPGYRIILAGNEIVKDGTSAVAPLWAGIVALANQARGRPLGLVHPLLYADRSLFRDVTSGNNRAGNIGYNAGAGWNACTGLGTPRGEEIIAKLFVPS
jgi:kumamolisin